MPYFGTLIARVFTSRGQLPVEGASVSVLLHQDHQPQTLLSTQVSGPSGTTQPITIHTPGPEASQSPRQEDPFTLCDVWVEHQGYQLLQIQNVPIFSDVVSMQDLPLIPLADEGQQSPGVVIISPQDL